MITREAAANFLDLILEPSPGMNGVVEATEFGLNITYGQGLVAALRSVANWFAENSDQDVYEYCLAQADELEDLMAKACVARDVSRMSTDVGYADMDLTVPGYEAAR